MRKKKRRRMKKEKKSCPSYIEVVVILVVSEEDLFAARPLTKLCFSKESICNGDILQLGFYYLD